MDEICNKCQLTRKMITMNRCMPRHFHFYPTSWSMPADLPRFRAVALRSKISALSKARAQSKYHLGTMSPKMATYILKPNTTCQGKGIQLFQDPDNINPTLFPAVVQR